MFARLFNSPELGQILIVKRLSDEDSTPELRFSYISHSGGGLSEVVIGGDDEGDVEDVMGEMEKLLETITMEEAESIIVEFESTIKEIFDGVEVE